MRPNASSKTARTVDIVLVANFTATSGTGNCRFLDIAHRLTALGANVEVVTSDFEHDFHTLRALPLPKTDFKITLVHEPGYTKNISVKRLLSQHVFGRNIAKFLRSRPTVPDLIYCATPPPVVASNCAAFAKQHGTAFVVDVQDLWPEAFGMRFKAPTALTWIFFRMIQASRFAYRQADAVLGVSQSYVDHAQRTARRALPTSVVFLGTSLADYAQYAQHNESPIETDCTKLVYAGTLSHSYDLPMVMDAMANLEHEDPRFQRLELLVLGDGPKRKDFEKYAEQLSIKTRFLGKLQYPAMVRELQDADIAVNPIVAGSAGSILNKVGDYAAAGLPVINTQESIEYRRLLDSYAAGVNCRSENSSDVAEAIRNLVDNPQRRAMMGCNSRRMAEELFDRDKTYAELANNILSLAQAN